MSKPVHFFAFQATDVAGVTKRYILRFPVNSLKIFVVRGYVFDKHGSALPFNSTH